MPEQGALPVALLWGTPDDVDELREVLREAGAEIVFESDTADCSTAEIRAAAPKVVLINLSASPDEQSPLLDELANSPDLRVVFNDASITHALSGWDRARWRRHLSAKLLDREDDLPPRPEAAPALRLPRAAAAAFAPRAAATGPRSEQAVEAEMDRGLSKIADTTGAGPPPRHDWASELDADGTADLPLDSLDTQGVAQRAMGEGMEPTDRIELDAALDLNDAEREVLGNLQSFDADGGADIVPPQTLGRGEQRVDLRLDESAFPGIQVDDFPPNDSGAPLGAADEELRLHDEVTSDEAMPARLDAPAGFAEMSLAPLDDGSAAPELSGSDNAASAKSAFGSLELESAGRAPVEGRASFAIDTADRSVSDLSSSSKKPAVAKDRDAPGVWVLLGGGGSESGMLELLGELPPALPVSFVVLRTDGPEVAAAVLPLAWWAEDASLAPGQAVLLDTATGFEFDESGRLLRTAKAGGRFDAIDAALEKLARQFGSRLGVVLFEGQGMDGTEGVASVIKNGGTVWSATADGESAAWNARARELGALAQQGSALDVAQRIAKQHG